MKWGERITRENNEKRASISADMGRDFYREQNSRLAHRTDELLDRDVFTLPIWVWILLGALLVATVAGALITG